MPVYKSKNTSGKVVWRYQFTLGATREKQELFWKSGFTTKQEAVAAETLRRAKEQVRKASAGGVAAPMPTTLAMLLEEFMQQHAKENLAPTTIEGYEMMRAYLSPELLAMTLNEITQLNLSREWARLLKSGGHTRRTKEPRPMKPKTVRNIAGIVSSAFVRAIKWGPTNTTPGTHGDLPNSKSASAYRCFHPSRIR
jgi:hypothetical protein